MEFHARDQQTLLGFLAGHYAAHERPVFIRKTIAALPGVVPAERCWFREFSVSPPRVTLVVHPTEVKDETIEQALERNLNKHPGIAYRLRTYDPRAIQLSDFLTTPRLHRSALYQEFYRPLGVENQISVAVEMGPSTWVVIALGRSGRDFSPRDRRCLNVLLPHLVEGFRNASALSRHARRQPFSVPIVTDAPFVILNKGTRAPLAPPHAQTLLIEYLGKGARFGYLPDSFQRWVHQHTRATTSSSELPMARQPFIVERAGKRLMVRLFSDGNQHSLFLQEEIIDHLLPLRSLDLTERENQILNWLALGRHNREIGAALKIQPRTVSKHLERIFLKLGVDSRTAAVMKVLGLISETAPPPKPR